jgi:hypothetical protein
MYISSFDIRRSCSEPRTVLANTILVSLRQRVPDSIAVLRGSLARNDADYYSDIDVRWEVPDDRFASAVTEVGNTLATAGAIESLRSDPAFQHSEKRRLLYVRFQNVPLFWRLDLDVLARSVGRDDAYDRTNAAARGSVWSPTESALMNVVGALKAHYRKDEETARELLRRGYERVGPTPGHEHLCDQMVELTEGIRVVDPATSDLVERILELVTETCPKNRRRRGDEA